MLKITLKFFLSFLSEKRRRNKISKNDIGKLHINSKLVIYVKGRGAYNGRKTKKENPNHEVNRTKYGNETKLEQIPGYFVYAKSGMPGKKYQNKQGEEK